LHSPTLDSAVFTFSRGWEEIAQLAIAVLAGIAIGGAGTWYFAYRPLKEAADYILWLKESPAPRKDAAQGGADAHSHASHGTKSKGSQESLPPTVDNQEREQP
jgi:hypothetical protein